MGRTKFDQKDLPFNGRSQSLGAVLSGRAWLRRLFLGAVVKFIIQISKGIIRDTRMRRSAMFYSLLVALCMLFAGAVLIDGWLREHIFVFLVWWAACAWLTLLAVLLAIFDMLVVRAAARRERRRLEREFLGKPPGTDDADS